MMFHKQTPASIKESSKPSHKTPGKSDGDEKRHSILIVDDDEFLLNIYSGAFQENDFHVIAAHDGQEAWELIEKGLVPDVVFTGIIMPRMTGFDLIERMKADDRLTSIPIAIFSHRGLPEHEQRAEELGVDEFIVQNLTPPREAIRRIKLIMGLHTTYLVPISVRRDDAHALIHFLNRQYGFHCIPDEHGEVILELKAEAKHGTFTIRPGCKKPEHSAPPPSFTKSNHHITNL